MKNRKYLQVLLLAVMLLIWCLPTSANAQERDPRACGDNLTWTLDPEGTLTVSGTGDMYDFTYGSDNVCNYPWCNDTWYIKKVVISDGVTRIGDCAFWNLPDLKEVIIGNDVSYIGEQAFAQSDSITSISIL